MKKKTTTIMVNGESWKVPRGFGVWYKAEARAQLGETRDGKLEQCQIEAIADLMRLVGYAPTHEVVASWPLRKRVEAVVFCAVVALRASDNAIQRHPALSWLPEPWNGPPADLSHIRADLRGAFDGPTPTEIAA